MSFYSVAILKWKLTVFNFLVDKKNFDIKILKIDYDIIIIINNYNYYN